MRAVQFSAYGGPEVLRLVDDAPEPHAGPGRVRVAVRAAGVNQADGKMRRGEFGGSAITTPRTPGFEVSGVVDEVGDGVEDVAVGDAVFGSATSGGAAEYAVLEAFAAKPEGLSWPEAAGLPVAVETAVRALDLLGVERGMTLLINGAAGAVGQSAVQFARERGALVIGTASPPRHDLLRDLGAEPTTYGAGLVERVNALADGRVDRALDAAGYEALPALIEITGSPEHVVTVADFAAAEGLGVRATGGSEGRSWHALELAATMFTAGTFRLPVARTFPLAEIGEAQRISEEGHAQGKLVLVL